MNYLESLLKGNIASFKKEIEAKIAEKVFSKLESRKKEIAGGLFGESKEEKPNLRHIKTYTEGNKTAKVYKDKDWDEYRVKTYTDNVHHKNNDAHTDDLEDAHTTAKAWLKSDNKNK
jgi:hypothetical protein